MSTTAIITLGVAVLALLAVLVLAALLAGERRRTARLLGETRVEQQALQKRVEQLTAIRIPAAGGTSEVAQFVITTAGEPEPDPVPDRIVFSATLGAPLVKAAALGHGVRRALSAESRNRIRFAVRREVRRSRKQRRQEMREAWRRMRAEEPAA